MNRITVSLCTALLFVAATSRADAPVQTDLVDRAESPWTARPFAVVVHAGLGTPYGEGGLAVEYTYAKWFSLEGGLGYGFSGLQVSTMARFRAAFGGFGLYAGGGVSQTIGTYQTFGLMSPGDNYDSPTWANAELGVEYRFQGGVEIRLYGGIGTMLENQGIACGEGDSCQHGRVVSPSLGMAVGYSFF